MRKKRKLTVEPFGKTHGMYNGYDCDGSTIRLKGQWLRRLGFEPGLTVELTAVSPGVLEIRLCGTPAPTESFQIMAHRLDIAIALDEQRKKAQV